MGWVGDIVSVLLIHMYVYPVHSSCTKNSFCSTSFEKIVRFNSYFIHRCIIIRYRSNLIAGKIHMVLGELWSICKSYDPLAWKLSL